MKHFVLKYKLLCLPVARYACYLLACITLITSCKNDMDVNRQYKNKLVVLAEITAGDSAFIPVTSSLVAGNGSPVQFEKPRDATVIISSQNAIKNLLKFNNSTDFSEVPAAIYSHPYIFKHNTDYALDITHPSLGAITASTHIPAPFAVKNVESDESDFLGNAVLNFKFDIVDASNEQNNYIFEAVKQLVHLSRYFYWQGVRHSFDTPAGKDLHDFLEDEHNTDIAIKKDTVATKKYILLNTFTSDTKTDNNSIGSLDSSSRRIFITDTLFNGQTYTSTISIIMNQFVAVDPLEKGVVIIRIKSVDKQFYKYMLQHERYKTQFGKMPVAQLSSPGGNIQNGLGIFGGSYKKEWKFFYDDLE